MGIVPELVEGRLELTDCGTELGRKIRQVEAAELQEPTM